MGKPPVALVNFIIGVREGRRPVFIQLFYVIKCEKAAGTNLKPSMNFRICLDIWHSCNSVEKGACHSQNLTLLVAKGVRIVIPKMFLTVLKSPSLSRFTYKPEC
jgi:hypothetical protein